MQRLITSLFTAILFLTAVDSLHGQIKIDRKPAPKVGPDEMVVYTWVSSWGLRDDPPNKYPHGIATHKTEAEAVAAAKAHMARTAGNGKLAVTHYLIEGEPKVRKKLAVYAEKAKDLLGRLKQAKKAVDEAKKVAKGEQSLLKASERKLLDTIKEYRDMVKQSLKQAMEAKSTLTKGVGSQTEAKFRAVNQLIDRYNREVNDFRSVMGKEVSLGYSPMERVQWKPSTKANSDKSTKGSLEGTTWYGYVEGKKYNFKFERGRIFCTSSPGDKGLRYTQNGDHLIIIDHRGHENGCFIRGDRIQGKGRDWWWDLHKY